MEDQIMSFVVLYGMLFIFVFGVSYVYKMVIDFTEVTLFNVLFMFIWAIVPIGLPMLVFYESYKEGLFANNAINFIKFGLIIAIVIICFCGVVKLIHRIHRTREQPTT